MSAATEESLPSSNEKDFLQSSTMSGITDSSGVVENVSESVYYDEDVHSNKENLRDNKEIEAVSDKSSCLVEQLDNSSCSFKASEKTGIIDKQDSDRINNDIESEEGQYPGAAEIVVPPKEFCDSDINESNLILLETEECTTLLNYTQVLTCQGVNDDNLMQEYSTEINTGKVTSENIVEENLIDLENPLSDSKDCTINKVFQVDINEQTEAAQYTDYYKSENIKEIETHENQNPFEISVCDAQVDFTTVNKNKLQLNQKDEKVNCFDEEKHEEVNILNHGNGSVLIQTQDEIKNSIFENFLLKNKNSEFKKIKNDSQASLETGNTAICQSLVQNQITGINDFSTDTDNVNNETSLESDNNLNAKEAYSIEVKDIDVAVVKDSQLINQLNVDQEQNVTSTEFESSTVESNNNVNSLLKDDSNQTQMMEKELLQDETAVKYSKISEAANFKEVCNSLGVATNFKKNQSFVTDESLSVIKDEMSKNIEKDISESNCVAVNASLMDTVKTVLQKDENDSKLVLNESEEKTYGNTEKLIEETVSANAVSNFMMVDDSNIIEDKKSVEDKKPISKDEGSLIIDQKDNFIKMDNTIIDTVQCLNTENKDLPDACKKPEVLINTLQGMKWLKSGLSNEVTQISNQLKSLPKKNERADDNLFEGTTRKNVNKRRRSGHNKNDKTNTASQQKSSEVKNLQNSQGSQLQNKTEQMKKETNPSVWNSNNTAQQLFSKSSTEEAVLVDRINEEEDIIIALVESICTAQQESERRKMSETKLKIKILDEPDDDQWGKIRRNVPNDDKGINQSTEKGMVDKYGRVDGYSEKHMFMGKNARRREQEFLKSQAENKSQVEVAQTKTLENKSQVGPCQGKSSENKSQITPTQTKPPEGKVTQSRPNTRSETTDKSQNVDPTKKEMHQVNKCQERPIHGRAGNEGPPGQAELQKPGFNQSSNKDINQNVKQGQNFAAVQNTANNVGQPHGKNQDSSYRHQQSFGQQRYRNPDSANKDIEKSNLQQSCSTGYQDFKQQENNNKVQSFSDRNQGNSLRNQDKNNQNQNQSIKSQTNSDQTNKGQSSDQLSRGRNYSDQSNKNTIKHDSFNKNQVYADRTGSDSSQNLNSLSKNQAHSNKNQGNTVQSRTNSGQTQNQAFCDRNQGKTVQNQPNPGQNKNQILDNRQHQTNLSTNQVNSGQKQVSSVQNQNYTDKNKSQLNQTNASRDQDNFGRNQNYYDKNHCNAPRNQDGHKTSQDNCRYQGNYKSQDGFRNQNSYRTQDSFRSQDGYRNQDSCRNQDSFKNQDRCKSQGYTDNVTKHQDNFNRVENNSDRGHANQNYTAGSHGNQNYTDRSHGNQNNSDWNYSGRSYDLHGRNQNSDNTKGNYQNQCYSDRNKDKAFQNHDNYRDNQSRDNQQKCFDNYDKNKCYGNKQQGNTKQIKENQMKVPMEENWDDDQSTLQCNQQVYNQRAIKSQDSKVDHQSSFLENKKVSIDKTVGSQQTATPTSTIYRDESSSQVYMPLNPIIKTVQEIKPELTDVKKVDIEPKPNIVMAFDGNVNIQRALGLDRSTNYNLPTVPASNASVSTTLSQMLNSSVSQSLPLTQTSQIPANYDAVVMCAGGTMNVNAPPFNSTNFATAPFSTDLEASFLNSPLEVSESQNPTASRIANSSEEILQAHRDVATLSKQLATAEAKLLALNVKFYNEYMASINAQNSPTISSDGTIGDIQPQPTRLLQPVADFVAMPQTVPQGFQIPTTVGQNVVSPVSFDASRNFATVSMQDMSNDAYHLNAAFQQRLSLQSMYVQPGGIYQPQTAANYQPQPQSGATYQPQPQSGATYQPQPQSTASYQPQPQSTATYQTQPQSAASFQSQAVANYQQYSAELNAANRLHMGRGTPPNSEQKDLRVGGHQFYNQ